jgi:choline-sulfatase
VPLVVSAPARYAPRRVGASVSLVDILPTLVDMAGGDSAALGKTIDGRSLVPHLEGREGHDEAIGEYLAEGAIAPMVMIRRGNHKFIHSPPDPDQLYDLLADPMERDNLAARAAEAERVADFREEAARRWNLPALDAQVRESQRRRRVVDAALSKGEVHSWDFQPRRDAAKLYVRNTMALDDIEAMARFPRVAPWGSDTGGESTAG